MKITNEIKYKITYDVEKINKNNKNAKRMIKILKKSPTIDKDVKDILLFLLRNML